MENTTAEAMLIEKATSILLDGGILAYPTEAVYGLGCLPTFDVAIEKLLHLKHRPKEKGLIIVAESIEQLSPYICITEDTRIDEVKKSWPGPVTWLLPVQEHVSDFISGGSELIAARVSNHPIIRAICRNVGPLISTSANPAGQEPAKTPEKVAEYFDNQLDFILPGELGGANKPTEIRHSLSGEIIRAGS